MPISVQQTLEHIRGTAGTLGGDTALDALHVLNLAGSYFSTFEKWGFYSRASVTLDLVAGQSYIALPADFLQFEESIGTETLTTGLRVGDGEDILYARLYGISRIGSHIYTLRYRPDPTSGAYLPVLDIAPVPTESQAAAFTMFYRAGWATVQSDQGIIPIPDFAVPLFVMFCRAFARGLEQEDEGALHLRLHEIEMSSMAKRALALNGGQQPTYGRISGGAVRSARHFPRTYLTRPPAGPG